MKPRYSTGELLEAIEAIKTEPRTSIERREAVQHVFERMKQAFLEAGATYYADVNDIYGMYGQDEELVVRREDPLAIAQSILWNRDLPVGTGERPGEVSANSVAWRRSDGELGLKTAFLEGRATAGGIATVVGIRRGTDLELRTIPQSEFDPRPDRRLVRNATGIIHPNEIEFVIVRVPATHFPKQDMTDEEADRYEDEIESGHRNRMQVLRAFSFRSRSSEASPVAAE